MNPDLNAAIYELDHVCLADVYCNAILTQTQARALLAYIDELRKHESPYVVRCGCCIKSIKRGDRVLYCGACERLGQPQKRGKCKAVRR